MSVDDFDGAGVSSDGPGFEVVDRRRVVLGGLAAAAGAGLVASVVEPAAAADGAPVLLGAANSASATTAIFTTSGSGLQGQTSATKSVGVRGVDASASGGGSGVWGQSTNGTGVAGRTAGAGYSAVLGNNVNTTTAGFGVRGVTTKGFGVRGETADAGGAGVLGVDLTGSGNGVIGETASGWGVHGFANGTNGSALGASAYGAGGIGVNAYTSGANGYAVHASAGAATGIGVYGYGQAYAGYFEGKVYVSGTLSKGGGSFRIDHPVDPANKFLSHSFVESPDMMNIYNGLAILDDQGRATVEMPDWFEALNRDFRYQLTAIGDAAPNLRVGSKMKDGSFSIAGGGKGQEVSWQVTGIRQDSWANANRIPVEEDKTASERGKYLHPDVVKGVRNAEAIHVGPKVKTPPKSNVPMDLPIR